MENLFALERESTKRNGVIFCFFSDDQLLLTSYQLRLPNDTTESNQNVSSPCNLSHVVSMPSVREKLQRPATSHFKGS